MCRDTLKEMTIVVLFLFFLELIMLRTVVFEHPLIGADMVVPADLKSILGAALSRYNIIGKIHTIPDVTDLWRLFIYIISFDNKVIYLKLSILLLHLFIALATYFAMRRLLGIPWYASMLGSAYYAFNVGYASLGFDDGRLLSWLFLPLIYSLTFLYLIGEREDNKKMLAAIFLLSFLENLTMIGVYVAFLLSVITTLILLVIFTSLKKIVGNGLERRSTIFLKRFLLLIVVLILPLMILFSSTFGVHTIQQKIASSPKLLTSWYSKEITLLKVLSVMLLGREPYCLKALPHGFFVFLINGAIASSYVVLPLKTMRRIRMKSGKYNMLLHLYIVSSYLVTVNFILILANPWLTAKIPMLYLLAPVESPSRWSPVLSLELSFMLAYLASYKSMSDKGHGYEISRVQILATVLFIAYMVLIAIDSGSLGFNQLQWNVYQMKTYANSIEKLYELYDKGLLLKDSFSIVLPANGITLSALKEYHVKDPIWCINSQARATLSTLYGMIYRGEFTPSIIHTLRKLNIRYVIILKDIPFIKTGKRWDWYRAYLFFENSCKLIYDDQYLAVFDISNNNGEKPYSIHIDVLTQTLQIRVRDIHPLKLVLPLEIHGEITIVNKSCDYLVTPFNISEINLLKNPSFEEWKNGEPEYWSLHSSQFNISKAEGYEGLFSIKVSTNSSKERTWSWIKSISINVKPREAYLIVTHMKIFNAKASHVAVYAYFSDKNVRKQIVQVPSGRSGTFDWREFKRLVIIPDNVTKLRIVLNAGWTLNKSIGYSVTYFDSIYVIPLEEYHPGFLTLYIKPISKNCEIIIHYNPLKYMITYILILIAEILVILITIRYLVSLREYGVKAW